MKSLDQMERLKTVVGAYGADRTRWPAADRASLEVFIDSNVEAAAFLADEAAFDRVLALGSFGSPPVDVELSKSRLLARFEAERSSPVAASSLTSATVVPFSRPAAKAAASPSPRRLWREFGLMAAALLLGFFSVSQGVLDGSALDLSQTGDTVSLSSGDSDDVSAIALGGNSDELSEEDLL